MRVTRRYLQKVIQMKTGCQRDRKGPQFNSIELLKIVTDAIVEQLCVGNEVYLNDFGSFTIMRRKIQCQDFQRGGRLPSREIVSVRFTPGKELKLRVRALIKPKRPPLGEVSSVTPSPTPQ